ncbi:MAG TPA: SRPBCC family protein [Actinomycetales bacterium]|nr:SRPBCC family protein [Actinomycetales bacterium]
MARFTTSTEARAPAADVWRLLTDWPAHSRFVPLTRITRTGDGVGGVGDRFTARTGLACCAFDDPMEVVEWVPPDGDAPGRCVVAKLGRVLLGRAVIDVVPLSRASCRARWSEDVEIAPAGLTRVAGPLVGLVGGLGFGRVLRAMVAEVEAR